MPLSAANAAAREAPLPDFVKAGRRRLFVEESVRDYLSGRRLLDSTDAMPSRIEMTRQQDGDGEQGKGDGYALHRGHLCRYGAPRTAMHRLRSCICGDEPNYRKAAVQKVSQPLFLACGRPSSSCACRATWKTDPPEAAQERSKWTWNRGQEPRR